MNCLWDYIGIKGCGTTKPLSGMFINQLPGLTIERIDKVAEKEQVNFVGVWNDVRERAWRRIQKDLRRQLRTVFKLKTIKDFATVKTVIDKDTVISAAGKLRGVVIDLGSSSGKFLSQYIQSISLTLTAAASNVAIKLFDSDGILLDTLTVVNAVEGKNTVDVSNGYFTKKIFIATDASMLDLYSASLPAEIAAGCSDLVCNACEGECDASVFGAEAGLNEPENFTSTNNIFGFEVNYSILCDYSTIVCSNKEEFLDTWMFALGTELMLENLYSTRLTRFTTVDKQEAADLKDYYTKEYEDALEEAIKGLDVSSDDCCISCDQKYSYREALP